MKLLIVVVNFRTPQLTIDCLRSLSNEGMSFDTFRTVVVDNDSGDDSSAKIRAAVAENGWGAWTDVVDSGRNGGFAFGNNVAIRPALASADPPEYVLLLNSDTVVRPGALQTLVQFLEERPEIGLVGSRCEDPDGTQQCSAFRFPSIPGEFAEAVSIGFVNRLLHRYIVLPGIPTTACPTDWVAGASMLIRREVFDRIGLLDEGYFMYYEETDFCLRAARAGYPCWYEPASRVVHLVGASSGVTERKKQVKRRPAYWFESRRRYFVKNYGRAYVAAVDAVWSLGYAARQLKLFLTRRPNLDPPRLLLDYLRHSIFFRGFRAAAKEAK
jgi:N-acetylglucosaminyl-diphospho-decaprenol L-rhamnosyltransferase